MPLDLSVWKGATRMSPPVVGFLPLKTPIDAADIEIDEEDEFTVSMFMERQAADGRSVGLCVDLTAAQPSGTRLYDTEEWARDWDVQYVSLPCAPPLAEATQGSSTSWIEGVPPDELVTKFLATVDEFWAQPQNRRLHIAVLCVTGVNLSAYMIARFGMRVAPLERALGAFVASRRQGLYAPDLLEDLWRHAAAGGQPGPQRD